MNARDIFKFFSLFWCFYGLNLHVVGGIRTACAGHPSGYREGGDCMSERHGLIQYALEWKMRPGARESRKRAAPDGFSIRNARGDRDGQ